MTSGGRRRVGVLVSGAGSNLRALLDAAASPVPPFPAEVVVVLSNRPSAGALRIAAERGVPAAALPVADFGGDAARRDAAILERLRSAGVELVVTAGYDRILSLELVAAYPGAILNIHPSLLPAFGGGMDAVEQALAAGVRVTGCTVHLIETGHAVDGGPIVLQAPVAVEPDDDAESLRARIHVEEWRLLPEAVRLWAEGRLSLPGGRVRVADPTAVDREPPLRPAAGRPLIPAAYGIGDNDPAATPWAHAERLLARARNYWVVTASSAGRPHAAPVWGLWQGGELRFSTSRLSRKGRNLLATGRAIVHLESAEEVVILGGPVAELTDPDELGRMCDAYLRKYHLRPDPGGGDLFVALRPEHALTWRERDFPRSALRWRLATAAAELPTGAR